MRHEGEVSYYWFSKTDSIGMKWTNGLLRTDRAYFLLEYDEKFNEDTRWITACYLTPCCAALPHRREEKLTCSSCPTVYNFGPDHWFLTRNSTYPAVDEVEQVKALEAWLMLMGHGVFESVLLASHINEVVASIVAEPPPLWPPPASVNTVEENLKHAIAASKGERSW